MKQLHSYEGLAAEIRQKKYHPVYALFGEDEYPVQALVKLLREAVAQGPMAQFNLDELSGQSLSWDTVLERSRTLPMMASHRLVIAWDVDKLAKKGEDDLADIEAYLKNPLPETVLVLTAKAFDKRTRFYKALEAGATALFEAAHPKAHEVPAVVKRFAKGFNKDIDDVAARSIADLVGTETMWIRNEVEKLCVYVGDRPRITDEDVQAVMADINQRDVWALTEAMAKRDFAACMRLLEPILRESEPVQVFGALAFEMRRVAKAKRLQEARRSRDEIMREVRINYGAQDRFFANLKGFSLDDMNRVYRRLEATDLRLKRTGQPARLVLEALIADICLG
jgi:DNA polymerase-3 subunit delta